MNERIRECWLKAAREDSSETWDTQEQFIERFAKLIVSECMDVLDPGENQLIARFQARQWLAEHFGDE
jgi:hypothetical protein